MGSKLVVDTARRINDRLAEEARREHGGVTFVCECGACDLTLVRITLDEFDQIRDRDDSVIAPGH